MSMDTHTIKCPHCGSVEEYEEEDLFDITNNGGTVVEHGVPGGIYSKCCDEYIIVTTRLQITVKKENN